MKMALPRPGLSRWIENRYAAAVALNDVLDMARIEAGPSASTTPPRAVIDSGAGLPGDFDLRRGKSLGLQLVADLARQLGGTLEIGAGPGARFVVALTKTGAHQTGPMFPAVAENVRP